MSSGIAEPSLVRIRVLSRFGGAAGMMVVVLAGLEGMVAFLEATLAQFAGGLLVVGWDVSGEAWWAGRCCTRREG